MRDKLRRARTPSTSAQTSIVRRALRSEAAQRPLRVRCGSAQFALELPVSYSIEEVCFPESACLNHRQAPLHDKDRQRSPVPTPSQTERTDHLKDRATPQLSYGPLAHFRTWPPILQLHLRFQTLSPCLQQDELT